MACLSTELVKNGQELIMQTENELNKTPEPPAHCAETPPSQPGLEQERTQFRALILQNPNALIGFRGLMLVSRPWIVTPFVGY